MNFKVLADGATNLLIKRITGPFWIRRRWLKKTQWLSTQQLQQIQLQLLKKIIRHCYNSVPYYRSLMDEKGITVEHITTLDNVKRFPMLTKEDVLRAGKSIISTRYPKCLMRTAYTGGTTGTSLQIPRNLFSIGNEHAFVRRQWDWAGIALKDKCAYLTGRLIAKPNKTDGRLYAYDPIMKELILSAYHLSTDTAKDYVLAVKRYKVKAIVGYPSAIYLLARTCLDSGIELKLKSALTSSETLMESMRNTIAEAFQCKVFDFYGSAERVCYIHTCEHGSYHLVPEYGLTELIPVDSADNVRHKVISTGFWSMAMPLIRYDTGDIVTKSNETCPCGRAFKVIKSIIGRQGDVIKTPSGREFGAAILTHLLYGTNHIVQSQIIQDALSRIRIEYVPSEKFCSRDLKAFERLVAQHLPNELTVELKQVKTIPKTSSGKIKPVVSEIA